MRQIIEIITIINNTELISRLGLLGAMTIENTKLGKYSINEEKLIKATDNMLRFTTNSNNLVISKQFRRNVYDDGSDGYLLNYNIPD